MNHTITGTVGPDNGMLHPQFDTVRIPLPTPAVNVAPLKVKPLNATRVGRLASKIPVIADFMAA